MNEQLQRGIALARSGRRAEARSALMQAVDTDERNELAWLWLSGVVDEPDDIRVCLENVLAINPENRQARQGLEWLNARYGIPAAQELPDAIQPMLPSEDPDPEPEPAPRITAPERPLAPSTGEPDLPCPYCGAPTTIGQRNCLRCRHSLMIRGQPRQARSLWLTLLAFLFYIFVPLAVIVAAFPLAASVTSGLIAFSNDPTAAAAPASESPITLVLRVVVGLAAAGAAFWVGRGLLRRARAAYIAAAGVAGLMLIAGGMLLAQGDAGRATGAAAIILAILAGALAGLSFNDFVGAESRFQASFGRADHATHYNNGVAYKNRGMWYMAMREWELAVSRAPFDLNYLHALGLAYAQVGRFERARTTLDKAISIAPTHRQLAESRALVDQMAKAQQP